MRRSEEDYLKVIYEISAKDGYARVMDIAERLNVKPSSVTEMIKKLASKNLVVYRRYKAVTLTEEGKRIGEALKERYDALVELLRVLQVPEEIALDDACKMEHELHPETVNQLKKFMTFLKNCPKEMPRWMEHFIYYSETGKYPEECEEESDR